MKPVRGWCCCQRRHSRAPPDENPKIDSTSARGKAPIIASRWPHDLHRSAPAIVRARRVRARADRALDRRRRARRAAAHAFLATSFDAARAAAAARPRVAAGRDPGRSPAWRSRSRTCSTSPASRPPPARRCCADAPPAARRRPAVARLRAAGARADRPHQHDASSRSPASASIRTHGTPANPATPARPAPRIPGGSTSGGAVSVATGAAWVGARLGHRRLDPHPGGAAAASSASRTRRAWCRPTARVPLSTTLDTVCAMTRSVRDAVARCTRSSPTRTRARAAPAAGRAALRGRRRTVMLDGLDADRRARLRARLAALRGGRRADRGDRARADSARSRAINATGGFSAGRELGLASRAGSPSARPSYDPRVALAHRRGADDERRRLHRPASRARRDWIARMEQRARRLRRRALARPCRSSRRRSRSRARSPSDDGVLPRQRAAAAQPQRRQHARRLRALAALPRAPASCRSA